LSCASCYDVHADGAAGKRRTTAPNGAKMPFTVLWPLRDALA
jgi:hypothetical protein